MKHGMLRPLKFLIVKNGAHTLSFLFVMKTFAQKLF